MKQDIVIGSKVRGSDELIGDIIFENDFDGI